MIIDQLFTRPIFESQMDPITQFASNAHEAWRRNFDPTGTKPRIKKNSDGTEGDINVPFADLHPDWQKENLAAGHAAQHAVKHFGNNMEKAAEFIHRQWMKRNPKADYNAAQHVPYDDLSDDEKEKDRVHVRTMMRLMGHQLNEFAPSDDGEGPDQEEILRRLAAHWWNGNEHQMTRVEHTLTAMGWEIGQDDGYDDGGVFVVRPGDEHGRTYTSWSAEELDMNEAAPPGAKAERMVKHIKQGYAKDGKLTPKEKGIAFATAWKAHNAGKVEEGEITKNATGLKHRATDKYGAGDDEPHHYTGGRSGFSEPGKYARDLEHVNKQLVKDLDASMGISWKNRGPKGLEVDEQGVAEAAQGHTIEAHGVRGMDRRTWHKTFKNTDQMIAWAEKHDAEIVGTRDLEQARHHNLSPAQQGITEGTDDPAKDALIQALTGHSVDDPRELWVDLKEIGRGFKTPVSKQIRMALRSLSPDDAYELWDTALEIAGVTQDELDNMTDDMDDSRDVWDGNLRGVSPPATGQKKTKHKIHKTIYIESQGVAEGVAETVSMDQAKKVLRHYGADHFKTTTNELHFYKNGRPMSVDLIFNDDATRSVSLSQLNSVARQLKGQGVAEGLTEMDKSEPSAGRDTGPRSGPEREAKPITAKKATKDATDMLNRAVKDSHKKKDVKEGLVDKAAGVSLKMATPELLKMAGFIKAYIKAEAPDALPAMEEILQRLRFYSTQETGNYNIGALQNLHQLAMSIKSHLRPDSEVAPFLTEFIRIVKWYLDETIKLVNENNDPLMLKLRRAMVQEGRVKELADDLKTMSDADFMKKYGKAKAAIRKDMSRIDEKLTTSDPFAFPAAKASSGRAIDDPDIMGSLKGASEPKFDRFSKTSNEPKLDFRAGITGDDETEVEAEPQLAADPNPYMQSWGGKYATGGSSQPQWRYVEKGEDPARYGSDTISGTGTPDWRSIAAAGKPAAASGLPKMRFDRASNSLVPVDAPPALDLSPKTKDKLDRQTRSMKPADGSGANPNIDAATRDRARAWAAQQNAPGAALAGAMRSSGNPVDTEKKKADWKSIYNLNKSIIGDNPNSIKPGMKLKMPNGSTYSVQPGDTLSKIASNQINELSTNRLAQYKTAAAKDAKQADQEGDFKRGDKRFHGIVQATKKQFDNDAKKVDESRAARRALMARIVNSR